MVYAQHKLGEVLIPFTFPTGKFYDEYKRHYNKTLTYTKIDRLHDAYSDIVNDYGPYYPPFSGKIAQDKKSDYYKEYWNKMIEVSGYEKWDIISFLEVLYKLAQSGEIANKWWSLDIPESSVTAKVEKIVKKTSDAIPNPFDFFDKTMLKIYIPALLVGGVVLYLYLKPLKRRG